MRETQVKKKSYRLYVGIAQFILFKNIIKKSAFKAHNKNLNATKLMVIGLNQFYWQINFMRS